MMLSAGKYSRIILQVCVSFLPILFLFFIILSLSLFYFAQQCHTLNWTVIVVMSANNYLPLGIIPYWKVRNCALELGSWSLSLENLCFTHESWRWRNFSLLSGDDSHVGSQIHHCRDQLCSHHQGSDNSRHPVCLVQVSTQGQDCRMSQASEIHWWSLKIAMLGLDAHGMNPGSVWVWVPGLTKPELSVPV